MKTCTSWCEWNFL